MKNDKNKMSLEEFLKLVEENEEIDSSLKEKLNSLFKNLKRPSLFYVLTRKIKVFILALIFNFIGYYLSYGAFVFNYISVSKLDALLLVLILSSIKALFRSIRMNSNFKKNFFIHNTCFFLLLILIVYYFSNINFYYHFNSFLSIICYFIIGQLITEFLEVIYTKISLERRLF